MDEETELKILEFWEDVKDFGKIPENIKDKVNEEDTKSLLMKLSMGDNLFKNLNKRLSELKGNLRS